MRPATKLSELTSGIDQFNHLKTVREELKGDATDLSLKLTQLLHRLLNKNRLNVLYTGEQGRVATVKETLREAFFELSDEPLGEAIVYQPGIKQNEGLYYGPRCELCGRWGRCEEYFSFYWGI